MTPCDSRHMQRTPAPHALKSPRLPQARSHRRMCGHWVLLWLCLLHGAYCHIVNMCVWVFEFRPASTAHSKCMAPNNASHSIVRCSNKLAVSALHIIFLYSTSHGVPVATELSVCSEVRPGMHTVRDMLL